AAIDADVSGLKGQINEIRGRHRERLWTERLQETAEDRRAEVRAALDTPDSKRTTEQKQLAAAHAALAVTDADVDAVLTPGDREELASAAAQISTRNASRQRYGEIAIATEKAGPVVTHLLRRGNYLRPGLEVEPALFDVLLPLGRAGVPLAEDNPAGSSGRRLALARELTNPQSLAGNHVARVFVNRLWQQLTGRGLVATSDNFGASGQPPTHPELLDWLTIQFLRDGWRVKPTIRRIMLSSTYRQTSAADAHAESGRAAEIDPENRLLWRMNLRRLESEQVRDAILTVSGKLDRTVGGEPVPLDPRADGMVVIKTDGLPTPTAQYRRSVYLLARRNYHLTFLQAFDQPVLARTCSLRKPSAVVTQALELMNSDFLLEQADFLAERIASEAGDSIDQQIIAAYAVVLARLPDDEEASLCRGLLERHRERFSVATETHADARRRALAQLSRTLLNTTEFLYLR
ncbi:MAG: DUF1553 domain-containing protein, partial [Planctomycetaceae bacterium]|nr:DUF1553 domain-containing protein [Planctomycetaceae bacterium]